MLKSIWIQRVERREANLTIERKKATTVVDQINFVLILEIKKKAKASSTIHIHASV